MAKSKMSAGQKKKCHAIVHTATAAACAGGAIPLPFADALPIGAAQVTMIIALGKVFGLTVSESAAESIIRVAVATKLGRFLVSNILKAFPGPGQIIGISVSVATAAAITETLGWLVANDFFRMSAGKKPKHITGLVNDLERVLRLFPESSK